MILVCHVILEDPVIKGPCDFMGRSLPREVTILTSSMAIGTVVMDI